MILDYWGVNILGLLRKSRRIPAVAVSLAAAALSVFAATDLGVTRLGDAISAYEKRDFAMTVRLLGAPGQPAKLRDYVAYYMANAELMTNDGDSAITELAKYVTNPIQGS